MPEYNEKQNPEEFYPNKCQKHVACNYGFKLVCVDDKFRKYFKSYLIEDAVCNFINTINEESKYCPNIVKKKNFILTKYLWLL